MFQQTIQIQPFLEMNNGTGLKVINRDSDLILVLSSIQILATEHVFERWDLFPHRTENDKTLK